MNYPRVLVIANNSFSETNSNGRTLGNMFENWPKDAIAEFCISTDGPNFNICDKYYCVNDSAMLTGFLHLKKVDGVILHQQNEIQKIVSGKGKRKKTYFLSCIRNLVWSGQRWNTAYFRNWLSEYSPQLILLQNGDSAFILKIAYSIAKKYDIPIFMFNTENYYLMKNNYLNSGIKDFLWFYIYHYGIYKPFFRKIMNKISYVFHGNELLKQDYDEKFKIPSGVIYTGSSLNLTTKKIDLEHPVFSYLGSLYIDRYKVLCEVAEVLYCINPCFKLDIYGKADNEILEVFSKYPSINYHGFVNYQEVVNVIENSDVLFHVESQDKNIPVKYAFSTKIADSLKSKRCFVLYSAADIACAQYIKKYNIGWFAQNKEELKECIIEILTNEDKRNVILNNASRIAMKNHEISQISRQFQQILINEYSKIYDKV